MRLAPRKSFSNLTRCAKFSMTRILLSPSSNVRSSVFLSRFYSRREIAISYAGLSYSPSPPYSTPMNGTSHTVPPIQQQRLKYATITYNTTVGCTSYPINGILTYSTPYHTSILQMRLCTRYSVRNLVNFVRPSILAIRLKERSSVSRLTSESRPQIVSIWLIDWLIDWYTWLSYNSSLTR